MNNTIPVAVALTTLPRLVTLVQARKQARWQWSTCADEHKHRWTLVITSLDARIAQGERLLGQQMDLEGFRYKREIVE